MLHGGCFGWMLAMSPHVIITIEPIGIHCRRPRVTWVNILSTSAVSRSGSASAMNPQSVVSAQSYGPGKDW